jgi:hypothetical protein
MEISINGVQGQKILISAYDQFGVANYRQFEKFVVLWVAARTYTPHNRDPFADSSQKHDERLSVFILASSFNPN